MRIRKKLDFFKLFLYLLFFLSAVFLFHVGNNGEPLALALFYAAAAAGLSPLFCLFYPLPAWTAGGLTLFFVCVGQAILLCLGFFIQKRIRKTDFIKTGIVPMLFLSVALGLFVTLAPFTAYDTSILGLPALNTLTQKVLIAAFIFLFSAIVSVAVKALLRKFLKCRLRGDEVVFTVLLSAIIGVGICRFLGFNAYMGAAFLILLLFSYATKDMSVLLCAFVVSLPPFLVFSENIAVFFIYGIACALFIKTGRLAAVCGILLVFFAHGYQNGLYTLPTGQLVASLLSVLLPSLLFLLIPTTLLRRLENKVIFYREKHLSRIAINRNRAAIGEKLFEISSVFREIENAFSSLGQSDAQTGAKEYIRGCVLEEACKNCPNLENCRNTNVHIELDKVIEVGCMKGKVSFLDLPKRLADACINQSGVLYAVNRQLVEYTKYMTEAENAASGRKLLSNQAQGVSEILKNLALEQSEPLRLYTEKERALTVALLSAGIVCSEVMIYGEENNLTLSLITFGKANVKKIAAIASHLFQADMMISERLTLSHDKFCCILRKRPHFDAAFGVATVTKAGETACGDTHSVLKIDERRFLVALSDGMGSGEYARNVSESTITLLESFYKAKMPSELILSTINKLLTFNKEESFACVDIGIVDLDSGEADIIKIGAPLGFILSSSTVKVLESESLPLGILDSLHPTASAYTLEENDVLLFISDGILDAFGSSADLYEVLRAIPLHNPQQLADCLLEQALKAYGGKPKDDMTAVAVRLFAQHKQGA